jgi:hypothetical protein
MVSMTPSGSSLSCKAAAGQIQARVLSADSSSVASLTTTSYQGNALNLTAQEGSGESEPRNFITDLSVHDYSDNTIDSGRVEKVNVKETAIESTQTSAIENATSGSADESKCSQSTTPSNTVGLDLELAQHEKKCSEDKECAYEIQTGGAFGKFFTLKEGSIGLL